MREIALVVREVMDELGLASYPKTSGATGLHILAPIRPELPFPEVRRFAKALAEEVERRVGDQRIATTTWRVADRIGVFVDFGQNARDRTIASAYSVRPVPDARVSAPLLWHEVPDVDPAAFTIETMRERIADDRRPDARHVAPPAEPAAALRALGLEPSRPRPEQTVAYTTLKRARVRWTDAPAGGSSPRSSPCSPCPASASASPYVRYGIQDDAWLRFGPGTLEQRLDRLESLGVELVRLNVMWSEVEARQGAYDWSGYDAALDGPARAPHRDGADALLDARLGERRARDELGADERRDLRRLRAPRGAALPVGEALADLERAEPAALAPADDAGGLRQAPAQPGVRRDPQGAAGRARRRRRHRAARGHRRRLARRRGSTAWPRRARTSTRTRTTRTR